MSDFFRRMEAALDAARLADKMKELDAEIYSEENRRVGKETRRYTRLVELTRERAILRQQAAALQPAVDEARLKAARHDVATVMERYAVARDVRGYENIYDDFIPYYFRIIH
jgi:hypothetical protein